MGQAVAQDAAADWRVGMASEKAESKVLCAALATTLSATHQDRGFCSDTTAMNLFSKERFSSFRRGREDGVTKNYIHGATHLRAIGGPSIVRNSQC